MRFIAPCQNICRIQIKPHVFPFYFKEINLLFDVHYQNCNSNNKVPPRLLLCPTSFPSLPNLLMALLGPCRVMCRVNQQVYQLCRFINSVQKRMDLLKVCMSYAQHEAIRQHFIQARGPQERKVALKSNVGQP